MGLCEPSEWTIQCDFKGCKEEDSLDGAMDCDEAELIATESEWLVKLDGSCYCPKHSKNERTHK